MAGECKPAILIVDDEAINREILMEFLSETDFQLDEAENGQQAWQMLEENPQRYHVLLLDRMMPVMDGMTLLKQMRADSRFFALPVILQTARVIGPDIQEGMDAGAFYYLGKPYDDQLLVELVRSAVAESLEYYSLYAALQSLAESPGMSDHLYHIKTPDEARQLAVTLAHGCEAPYAAVVGIYELLSNAIEHGNLEIDYAQKGVMLKHGFLSREIEGRLASTRMQEREVQVQLQCADGKRRITIQDQGKGFDWQPYLMMRPDRGQDNHGRGIAVAHQLCHLDLQYQVPGNVVMVEIPCPM